MVETDEDAEEGAAAPGAAAATAGFALRTHKPCTSSATNPQMLRILLALDPSPPPSVSTSAKIRSVIAAPSHTASEMSSATISSAARGARPRKSKEANSSNLEE